MRHDFGKVVIERPRSGFIRKFGQVRNRRDLTKDKLRRLVATGVSAANDDLEDVCEAFELGGIEQTSKIYGWEAKELTDLLGPVTGYLHSKVGCLWDDVWSEVCSRLRGSEPVEHVRDHVIGFVEMVGGRNPRITEENVAFGDYFYVDKEGRLQRQIKRKFPKSERLYIDDMTFVRAAGERFWRFSDYEVHASKLSRKLVLESRSDHEQRISRTENFRLLVAEDGQEFVFLNHDWFAFAYKRVQDLHLDAGHGVKTALTLDYAKQKYVPMMADGERFVTYQYYSLMGGLKSKTVLASDLPEKPIRYKLHQANHAELKKAGLLGVAA